MKKKKSLLCISFSARRNGNCENLLKYTYSLLKDNVNSYEYLNITDYKIEPCSNCEYECFSEILTSNETACPKNDDLSKIYKKCNVHDIILFGIPCYGNHCPGIYRSFHERALTQFTSGAEYTVFKKKVNIILIANLPGGDNALHEVCIDFLEGRPEVIQFPAREYGMLSLKGDLIESDIVKDRLKGFSNMIIKKCKL